MAVEGTTLVSATNFTLTDSPSDTITLVVNNQGSGTFGYLDILLVGGGETYIATKRQMTAWGNETLTLSVDYDSLYEAIPQTSSDFDLEIYTYDTDGTTLVYSDIRTGYVTGTINTVYVHPTMTAARVGRYAGGSIHSDVYVGFGVIGMTSGNAAPSRGSATEYLDFEWGADGYVNGASNVNTIIQVQADRVSALESPVVVSYVDKRNLAVQQTLIDGTDFNLYTGYTLPEISAVAVRGTYSGGVWTANPIGDDVQVAVVLTADANALAEGHTVDLSVSLDGGAPQTQTVNADGAYYFYFTSVSKTASHEIGVTAEDDLQYGSTEFDFTLGLPNVIWQPYQDGSGFAFYATPKANEFTVGKPTALDSLKLDTPLAIKDGGTGSRSALAARSALGINWGGVSGGSPCPINLGGTGATTSNEALARLNSIGAAPARSGLLYANLAATGLVSGEATAYAIGNAMPANASISWTHNDADAIKLKNAPATYGTVTLLKGASSNVMSAFFNAASGRVYHWSYNPISSSALNNKWIEIPHGMGSAAMAQGVSSAQALTTSIANVKVTDSTTNPSPLWSFASSTGAWIAQMNGYIMASAQLFANGLTAQDRVYIDIARDRGGTVSAQVSARNRCYYADLTIVIPPTLVYVQSGDVIRLRARNDTAARGSVATGNATALTVWYA